MGDELRARRALADPVLAALPQRLPRLRILDDGVDDVVSELPMALPRLLAAGALPS